VFLPGLEGTSIKPLDLRMRAVGDSSLPCHRAPVFDQAVLVGGLAGARPDPSEDPVVATDLHARLDQAPAVLRLEGPVGPLVQELSACMGVAPRLPVVHGAVIRDREPPARLRGREAVIVLLAAPAPGRDLIEPPDLIEDPTADRQAGPAVPIDKAHRSG
jgi:hypothetical protein